MTLQQVDKMADRLADQYGLNQQLTLAWLCDQGIHKLKFSDVTLVPKQIESLIVFART